MYLDELIARSKRGSKQISSFREGSILNLFGVLVTNTNKDEYDPHGLYCPERIFPLLVSLNRVCFKGFLRVNLILILYK